MDVVGGDSLAWPGMHEWGRRHQLDLVLQRHLRVRNPANMNLAASDRGEPCLDGQGIF
jgi:hypothetical protein